MKMIARRFLIHTVGTLTLLILSFADAKATTYYIDTKGNNKNAGTSAAKAWADFAPVNARNFLPGDVILLKRGCTWNGELTIHGTGNANHFIKIAAYGSGSRPKIRRSGNPSDRCIRLINPAYVSLSNIEVCNGGAGIVLYYDHSYHNRSVYLDDIIAHDFMGLPAGGQTDRVTWSYGIGVTGVEDAAYDQTRVLSDFKVTRTEVYHTGAGIALDWGNHHCVDGTQALSNKFGDVYMEHLNLHDNTVDPVSFVSLFITSVTNCTVKNSIINNGTKYASSGTGTIQIMYTKNVTLQNVTVNNTAYNACPDNVAVDFECNNENPVIDGCTFTHNAGPAIEFLATPDNLNPTTRNAVISNCTFIGNDWAKKQGGYQVAIVDWDRAQTPTAKVFNNKYRNAAGTRFFGGSGNATQTQLYGNVNLDGPEREPVLVKEWKFDQAANLQGWKNGIYSNGISGLSVTGGVLTGNITGVDPSISWSDPSGLPIDSNTFIRITLKNASTATYGQIYFLTDTDHTPDKAKHTDFWLYADKATSRTYDIDLQAIKGWKGKLTTLRIDPEQGAANGTFSIASIALLKR